jgi:nitrile hydratase beta subunit-like protein
MTYERGARVRVSSRPHDGHHRTPSYLKGRAGVVERVHDSFTNPETRAYGADGLPEQRLYLLRFEQADLWPEYPGEPADQLYADVFEHWLEDA